MSPVYLLDTNIISEPLRPNPNPQVVARLEQHEHDLAIPAIVWHELIFGYQRLPTSTKQKIIEAYLNEVVATSLPILPYDAQAAAWHAIERGRLTALGKTPSFADGQIAAVAVVNDLILVTANSSDFGNFQDLHIENWVS